jgi:EAL domain-containing protein (putative c-di-GMP-specific phosphodiesterase class I)
LAHKLGIKVVAEGVETKTQDQILKDFACDFAQGYFYSRPVPVRSFEILLTDMPVKSSSAAKKNTA